MDVAGRQGYEDSVLFLNLMDQHASWPSARTTTRSRAFTNCWTCPMTHSEENIFAGAIELESS
jgi:hypothetical protein